MTEENQAVKDRESIAAIHGRRGAGFILESLAVAIGNGAFQNDLTGIEKVRLRDSMLRELHDKLNKVL